MSDALTLRLLPRIDDCPADAWDALAGPSPAISHAYLSALETSGCVAPERGWTPCHATLWQQDTLIAALPCYQKQHSYGEYVFDWAWAEAFERHGLRYYPKLLSALPFTPLPGQRILGRDDAARAALLQALLGVVREAGCSSWHVLFHTADEAKLLADAGLMLRHGVQFHWHNRGYRDFEDFLAHLNHDKRKKIRQERRKVAQAHPRFRWLDGASATTEDWRFFYQCYALTYALHRSTPYLNPDFFALLAQRMPEQVRLLIVDIDDRPFAAAFFLCDGSALYGRYWGATGHLPCLHFEVCYYQAIDYCIRHGLQRLEGGAQGEHKLARGLEPVTTHSAHWIADPRFADAIDRHLARERSGIGFYLDELDERSPFRKPGDTGSR